MNAVKETIFPLPTLLVPPVGAVPGKDDVIIIYKRTDKSNTCNDIGCSNDGDTEEKTEKGEYGIATVHYSITEEYDDSVHTALAKTASSSSSTVESANGGNVAD
jgi:hypothetical protein